MLINSLDLLKTNPMRHTSPIDGIFRLVFGSWFLVFGLPLYVLKHLIRYEMVSNLIYHVYSIPLIQYSAINI